MTVDTNRYTSTFYKYKRENEFSRNHYFLSKVLKILPKINSVVDFGCAVGNWLAVLKDMGIIEIKGYDGSWIDKDKLLIPKECFTAIDLSKPIVLEKRYDLAISIEVAEHLPKESAKIFIETLTNASDIVLFSAAIPYQTGINHINEQWQGYWYDLFYELGYVGIDIRSLIWDDDMIWHIYRQNAMLYVKHEKADEIKLDENKKTIPRKYLDVIHPKMYLKRDIEAMPLSHLYVKMIKRTIKRIIGIKNWEYIKIKIRN